MKQTIAVALLLLFATTSPAATLLERLGYPPDAKLLIVHADDLGMAHSVNAATTQAFATGLVNSGSIMIPCAWLPEVVTYAKQHPEADLGLHLTLTSEWAGLRWRPVLSKEEVPSLFDRQGYLYLTETEAASRMDPREAEAEIRAQIKRARELGIKPTHLDSHMGTLYQTRDLFLMMLRVAREEKLPARIGPAQVARPFAKSLLRPDDIVIDHIISIADDIPADQWAAWYTRQLLAMKPGVTEVILHLAHDDEEMKAVSIDHPGWGAAWRQRDLDYFTSDAFRTLLREQNIKLITWREIGKVLTSGARR
jgi:chitin disaccharide deacetylase